MASSSPENASTSKDASDIADGPTRSPSPKSSSSLSFVRSLNICLGSREIALRAILAPKIADDDGGGAGDDSAATALPANEVREQWAAHLRRTVSRKDWLAIWDPAALAPQAGADGNAAGEDGSEALNCVDVVEVRYETMTASIIVLQPDEATSELDDDENESPRSVSLLELFPILDEEDLDACQTASTALDHCRFFFKFIWRPWDVDDDSDDWSAEHLSNRFELFQEFQQIGALSRNWTRFEDLTWQYHDLEEELREIRQGHQDSDSYPTDVALLLEIEDKKEKVRKRALIIEDATLRMEVNLREQGKRRENRPAGKACHVVAPAGSLESITEYLREVNVALEGDVTGRARIFHTVDEAIKAAIRDDVVVVPGGDRYAVDDLGELEYGGVIVGIGEEEATIISKVKYQLELVQLHLSNVNLVF